MSTDCIITFDHPNGVYNSGDTLNGFVKLETEKSKSIRGISINVIGYGKVCWHKPRGKSSTIYSSHEQYLNSLTYVLGSKDGNSFDIEPGIYEYTFACELPKELPTSMIEDRSKIKYKIIVTIERFLRFDNVFKKDFIVNHITDLNLILENMEPRGIISIIPIASQFCLCCYNDGEIKAKLEIPFGGFVPGQNMPFQLIIYNDSNNNLSGAKIKLLKCYTFQSTEPDVKQKIYEHEIMTKFFNNIPRNSNKEFKDNFLIPYLPPTHHTQFIQLNYKLSAKIVDYKIKKINIEVPIIIGTIPLTDDIVLNLNQQIVNLCQMNINPDDNTSTNSTTGILPIKEWYI